MVAIVNGTTRRSIETPQDIEQRRLSTAEGLATPQTRQHKDRDRFRAEQVLPRRPIDRFASLSLRENDLSSLHDRIGRHRIGRHRMRWCLPANRIEWELCFRPRSLSYHDWMDQFAVDIGQTIIATGITIG